MSYICRACSEIYNDLLDTTDGCPKQRCGGDVDDLVYVDNAFAAVVAEFNKKGLEVESAYMGMPLNVAMETPSIVFSSFLLDEFSESEFKNEIFKGLPNDWRFRVRVPIDDNSKEKSPMIECVYFGGSTIERTIRFYENMMGIAKFASKLEPLSY